MSSSLPTTTSLHTSNEELPSHNDGHPSAETMFNTVKNSSCKISYTLSAQIANIDICSEHGKPCNVYVITVTKRYSKGKENTWEVARQYSDFECLHSKIMELCGNLENLTLPGKAGSSKKVRDFLWIFNEMNVDFLKTFAKKDKQFLENTLSNINAYLQALLQPSFLDKHGEILEVIFNFLEPRIWDQERYPLQREITTLERFKRNIYCYTANPMVIAEFWSDVLDNHVEEVLGRSVESFVSESEVAVEKARECAKYLAGVGKDCGIATTVGGGAGAVAGGLGIAGILLAPVTAGVSLGLTFGGIGLGIAAGVNNTGAGLAEARIKKTKREELQAATDDVVHTIGIFEDLLETCADAFVKAEQYIDTDEGRQYTKAVAEACNHMQKTPKKPINKESKIVLAISLASGAYSVAKGVTYNSARAIERTVRVAKLLKSGVSAHAGMVYDLGESAKGIAVAGRSLVRAGSTGARAFSVGLGVVGMGISIYELYKGAQAIRKPDEVAAKLQDFASWLDNSTKQLHDLYNKLTENDENKQELCE